MRRNWQSDSHNGKTQGSAAPEPGVGRFDGSATHGTGKLGAGKPSSGVLGGPTGCG
jgi:hypothetical protein